MEETKMSREERKLAAKKLKRQRIEAAGGKRPRPDKPKQQQQQQPSKKKKKSKSKKKPVQQHRFGRVMENAPCPNESRHSTLSLAIPGSIVSNAQTQELRTHLVGQIARAAAIYHVDEIVVFNDRLGKEIRPYFRSRRPRDNHNHRDGDRPSGSGRDAQNDNDNANANANDNSKDNPEEDTYQKRMQPSSDPHAFMARILQYCECPQYLRRHFFPMHPDLQFAGVLAPLDAPHHVRALDRSEFREGVVMEKMGTGDGKDAAAGSLVNCGIRNQPVQWVFLCLFWSKYLLSFNVHSIDPPYQSNPRIDRVLAPGIRCTVQIDPKAYTTPGKSLKGKVVSPSLPREKDGTYWGYSVRLASSIKAIFDESPYPNGYDLKLGTSERGNVSVDDDEFVKKHEAKRNGFQHAIIVLGGVAGIEECVDADETMDIAGEDSHSLFDMWVNVCQFQGSRTIRTEEAVLISLSRLRPFLFSKGMSGGDSGNAPVSDGSGKTKADDPATVEFSDEEPSDESGSSSEEDNNWWMNECGAITLILQNRNTVQ
jgi:predicted SPOUT superfamily RNA methylase MTH1